MAARAVSTATATLASAVQPRIGPKSAWSSGLMQADTMQAPVDVTIQVARNAPIPVTTRVQEAKAVKNRLHLDLRPKDQAAEVARLEALGARRVDIGQGPDTSWAVLADPYDNEFCVLRALRPDQIAAQAGG